MSVKKTRFDVAIIGAGFAGLTLAYQITKENSGIDICVIDQKEFPRDPSLHTIGESLNEVGGIYVSSILDLKDHMASSFFSKKGMRFFFEKEDGYCELGINSTPLNASFHFRRGQFENDLYEMLKPNVTFLTGYKCIGTDLEKNLKTLTVIDEAGVEKHLSAEWLVDASGMKKTIARKLGITKKLPLNHSSVWFRVDGDLDINEIYPVNDENTSMFSADIRNKASVHLEGPGYWVWILRLGADVTSVGITFNEDSYSFGDLSDLDRALSWLDSREKYFSAYLKEKQFKILDFKTLRRFSSQSERSISEENWALIGDAYGFWDPYYSNGFDMIGVQNTILTRIIADKTDHGYRGELIDFSNKFVELIFQSMKIMFSDFYDRKNNWDFIVYKYLVDSIFYFSFGCVIMIGFDFKSDEINARGLKIFEEALVIYDEIVSFLAKRFEAGGLSEANQYISLSGTIFTDVNANMQSVVGSPDKSLELLGKNLEMFIQIKDEIKSGAKISDILQSGAFNRVHHGL